MTHAGGGRRWAGGRRWLLLAMGVPAWALLLVFSSLSPAGKAVYRSPVDVAYAPDGTLLAASDRTADEVALINPASGQVVHRVAASRPAGLLWVDSRRLLVAEQGCRTVVEIDAEQGRVRRRLQAEARPTGLAWAPGRGLLLVTNGASRDVLVIDLRAGRPRARVACNGEPFAVGVTPDEKLAIVGHLLPTGDATDPTNAASIHLLDLELLQWVAEIRLPVGATAVREVVVSPDGRWAYVAHVLGRFNLPPTQLDRGWVATHAVSIIDLTARQLYTTFLLDLTTEGAADPWGLVLAADGNTLWVSLSGVHQLARVDLDGLHALLEGRAHASGAPPAASAEYQATSTDTWAAIRRDPAHRSLLPRDLTALYAAGLLARTPLPGKGPRGLDISPDGKQLAVAAYFSGQVDLVEPATGGVTRSVSLGPAAEPDLARRGEVMFHDATLCFQHWLSCATCHPESRADGLNWDLLNDGMGNPKNTRSLLLAHRTPPAMSQGVREDMETATVAGFRHILFREPQAGEAEAVMSYIRSLQPEISPYRSVNGRLSVRARRGEALFNSPQTKCATCHPPPLFTDQQLYDVGTRGPMDSAAEFDTPTLIESWRTPPYLHDGRALTMKDVLTTFNQEDRHGVTSHLTEEQVEDLAEYVLSL